MNVVKRTAQFIRFFDARFWKEVPWMTVKRVFKISFIIECLWIHWIIIWQGFLRFLKKIRTLWWHISPTHLSMSLVLFCLFIYFRNVGSRVLVYDWTDFGYKYEVSNNNLLLNRCKIMLQLPFGTESFPVISDAKLVTLINLLSKLSKL